MHRLFFIGILILFFEVRLEAQQKYQFYLKDEQVESKRVDFNLKASSGMWTITPETFLNGVEEHYYPLNIKGETTDEYSPNFDYQNGNKVCYCIFEVKDDEDKGIGNSLLGWHSPEKDGQWQVVLCRNYAYRMDLDYAIGMANIDLSSVPVENFMLETGSATIQMEYQPEEINPIVMDTFMIKVELGAVKIKRLNLSRARHIIAKVGLGKLSLDFTDELMDSSEVHAMVGAGTLEILLPSKDLPFIVYLKGSPLCRIKLPKSLEKIEDDVYASNAYLEEPEKAMSFSIDVSMGNLSLKLK
ncbi:hypothetical protein [Xanthovirga aplysinae]|uniref:hypothetical protein n=1 Tax=Xanthovirga aplysinae TaxID=2529853 RepID=UPI0012BCE30C|nr:hypothetical protein [Xanthovirga aplysinae]MTI29352.1 hypothetical protein [Xanthovirga aplysinae]